MTPIRALLFDKDGTLFDFQATWGAFTHDFVHRVAGDAAPRLAAAIDFDLDRRRFRPGSPVIAGTVEVMVEAVATVRPDLGREEIRGLVTEAGAEAEQIPPCPLPPLMARLAAAGYRLGVVTNDGEASARRNLESAGLGAAFEMVVGYDSGHGAKPEPGPLLAFARAAGLPPAEVLMIGDSTHDLHAARAAGMPALAVLTGVAGRAELAPHALDVVESVAALPDWLARRSGAGHLSQTAQR